MTNPHFNFVDPDFVSRYVEKGPAAFMPGHAGVLQMTGVLLAEAGFTGIETFYHAMNWQGWAAYA